MKIVFKGFVITILFFFPLQGMGISDSFYYPLSFQDTFKQKKDRALKDAIRKVLVSNHWSRKGKHDVLVKRCNANKQGICYKYKILSYQRARRILFEQLHLERDGRGTYITDIYCGKDFYVKRSNISHKGINCEHTWPRSKFNKKESQLAQESDLHHLFPVDSRANSMRRNFDFGEGGENVSSCNLSRLSDNTFEPPDGHKGNVARALFYFSVRYRIAINAGQERILKIWHVEDPVDDDERERNHKIYQIQRVRNPFIDFPSMVGRISNF